MFENSLADIYDNQASKFSSTRNKHRPEFEYMVNAIQQQIGQKNRHLEWHEVESKDLCNSDNRSLDKLEMIREGSEWQKKITILEVGCGDGRLVRAVSDKLEVGSFHYTGVDISQWLLDIANQRQNKDQRLKTQFIHSDMISHLQSVEESSVDIIVGIASVQHLFPHKTRQQFFDLAKKVLSPWWLLILINRARSDWAKEKYSRPRSFHLRQRIQTGAKRTSGDQMIPRIDPDTRHTHQRYYHFFSLEELRTHLVQGRDIRTLGYIDRDGSLTSSVRLARNSLVIASKT